MDVYLIENAEAWFDESMKERLKKGFENGGSQLRKGFFALLRMTWRDPGFRRDDAGMTPGWHRGSQ